jgi:hypothetical protein
MEAGWLWVHQLGGGHVAIVVRSTRAVSDVLTVPVVDTVALTRAFLLPLLFARPSSQWLYLQVASVKDLPLGN